MVDTSQEVKSTKLLVADSSSLILLQKTDILELLMDSYTVKICESVYREIAAGDVAGMVNYQGIQIERVNPSDHLPLAGRMGRGERDTLSLYFQLNADFILIDDKKGIRYCMDGSIPFINALLVPKVLLMSSVINHQRCWQAVDQLERYGYYSEKILARARKMAEEDLCEFFP